MIASYFQNPDGSFAVARFAISLIGAALALSTLFWFLPKALKTGKIPFFADMWMSQMTEVERASRPAYFWLAFISYLLLVPLGAYIFLSACFGPHHHW
jgi:hypothetical protein